MLESPVLAVSTLSSGKPEITFTVASGWLLKDSSIGRMRCDALEDLARGGQGFSAMGVWVGKSRELQFFRQEAGTELWHCSGDIDLGFAKGSTVRVLACPSAGALITDANSLFPEPPCIAKKRMQVHWKGFAATPWWVSPLRRQDLDTLRSAIEARANPNDRDVRHE